MMKPTSLACLRSMIAGIATRGAWEKIYDEPDRPIVGRNRQMRGVFN